MVNGRTKAVERESSIIKAQTRTRDEIEAGWVGTTAVCGGGVLERTREGCRDRIMRGGGQYKKKKSGRRIKKQKKDLQH